ncbi:hypothetical protein [Actinoallomurus iriomotensis]|uniref:Uncharacterized protein n=1 Tax=Actinoallomurus iriomotensis TaxID=478107 RepID=A0A9W6RZH4_9ACTN|nr:hypothetical protein [Actinoallomurus iriomotensis]GLY84649.1 hypothetical protein Airi02_025780 [Actinoallomurus iriomotensis]
MAFLQRGDGLTGEVDGLGPWSKNASPARRTSGRASHAGLGACPYGAMDPLKIRLRVRAEKTCRPISTLDLYGRRWAPLSGWG